MMKHAPAHKEIGYPLIISLAGLHSQRKPCFFLEIRFRIIVFTYLGIYINGCTLVITIIIEAMEVALADMFKTDELGTPFKLRVTRDGLISVVDVIMLVCYTDESNHIKKSARCNASESWKRVCQDFPDEFDDQDKVQFEGSGQRETPVLPKVGILRLLQVLPGKNPAQFRKGVAELVERYLSADESLAQDIQRRHDANQCSTSGSQLTYGQKGFTIMDGALQDGRSITTYQGKITVYLAQVTKDVGDIATGELSDEEFVKYGRTDHSDDRIDTHIRDFKTFILWAIFEVSNSGVVEDKFRREVRSLNIQVGKKLGSRNYKELFSKPDSMTFADFRDLLRRVVEDSGFDSCSLLQLEIEKLRLQYRMQYEHELTERIKQQEETKRHTLDAEIKRHNIEAEIKRHNIEAEIKRHNIEAEVKRHFTEEESKRLHDQEETKRLALQLRHGFPSRDVDEPSSAPIDEDPGTSQQAEVAPAVVRSSTPITGYPPTRCNRRSP